MRWLAALVMSNCPMAINRMLYKPLSPWDPEIIVKKFPSRTDQSRSERGESHCYEPIVDSSENQNERKMFSTRRTSLLLCLILVLGTIIAENGDLVLASGKKKFLKGFILGALLSKNHYPIVYSMPSHGGGHGGHGGYGW